MDVAVVSIRGTMSYLFKGNDVYALSSGDDDPGFDGLVHSRRLLHLTLGKVYYPSRGFHVYLFVTR